jgi:Holliday junction DNA helicase RuvA
MIATISGEISQILDGQLVIDIGGIGLLVNVTEDSCLSCRPGNKKAFHTYLVVREDHLSLYGFETMEARDLFVHLISVAGVGPKSGLALLSTLTPEEIRRGITGEQPEVFTKAPGIGKKTAQKIILDLQGKIRPLEPLETFSRIDEIDTEVIEALTTLGYSIVEAQAALQSISKDETSDVETRLRKALQYFS